MIFQGKMNTISKQELEDAVSSSSYMRDILVKLGYSQNSGTMYEAIRKKCSFYNIDMSHIGYGVGNTRKKSNYRKLMSLEDTMKVIFIENSEFKNVTSIKRYIKMFNLLDYRCDICGNEGTWLNIPITLQLDHKNGRNKDHRLDNLRFLCPNCHSQTENYGSKNNKGV